MIPAIFRRWLNLPVPLCTHAKGGRPISPPHRVARFYSIARQVVSTIGTMYPPPPPPREGAKMTPSRLRSLSLLAGLLLLAAALPVWGQFTDYDTDGDRLIEVRNIAQLNAMRLDPDGNGYPLSGRQNEYNNPTGAFPGLYAPHSCVSTCLGYELMADLTFPATNDTSNWTPIDNWATTLEGNGHTISGLKVYHSGTAGLFGLVTSAGRIRNLGIINSTFRCTRQGRGIGAIAGQLNGGYIISSYVSGGSVTLSADLGFVGGLVGNNNTGNIWASYATASVITTGSLSIIRVGGLVGQNEGTIQASYAAGTVSGTASALYIGGLVGQGSGTGTVINSYCDTEATGQTCGSSGKTTSQLKTPTGYTGIYENWNIYLGAGNLNPYYPWKFGTSRAYPTLNTPSQRLTAIQADVPQHVMLTSSSDTLIVRWIAPSKVTGYKVQWKSGSNNYPTSDQSTNTHGQATVNASTTIYKIANLTNGTPYTVRVLAVRTGVSDVSSAEAMFTPPGIEYDSDGDGLIDILNLAQLHAIRWDLNGDGVVDSPTDYPAYSTTFPNPAEGLGCPSNSCTGYELMADLNFDENGDNQITAADTTYWNGGDGWVPIGPRFGSPYAETVARINNLSFNATFEGNGYVIKNLFIDHRRDWSGLFAALRDSAVVRSLGLPNAQVLDGGGSVAPLAGQNSGRVAAVWATGSVRGTPTSAVWWVTTCRVLRSWRATRWRRSNARQRAV